VEVSRGGAPSVCDPARRRYSFTLCVLFVTDRPPRMRDAWPAHVLRARVPDAGPGWFAAGLAFSLLMLLVHAAAALHTGGVPDS